MARPLNKVQHVKRLARKKFAFIYRLTQGSHEVVKVALFNAEKPRHPEQVIPLHLGAPETVVVAKSDSGEVHDWAVHLVQDGDMRVPVILHHCSGHLVEEDGERANEGRCPEQAADGDSSGQEDVADPVQGAVGSKNGNV